jgi:hypothetical protein
MMEVMASGAGRAAIGSGVAGASVRSRRRIGGGLLLEVELPYRRSSEILEAQTLTV